MSNKTPSKASSSSHFRFCFGCLAEHAGYAKQNVHRKRLAVQIYYFLNVSHSHFAGKKKMPVYVHKQALMLHLILWPAWRSERINNPTSPRSRSAKSVTDTKLEKTSLSADAFWGAPYGSFILSELCIGCLVKNSEHNVILQVNR